MDDSHHDANFQAVFARHAAVAQHLNGAIGRADFGFFSQADLLHCLAAVQALHNQVKDFFRPFKAVGQAEMEVAAVIDGAKTDFQIAGFGVRDGHEAAFQTKAKGAVAGGVEGGFGAVPGAAHGVFQGFGMAEFVYVNVYANDFRVSEKFGVGRDDFGDGGEFCGVLGTDVEFHGNMIAKNRLMYILRLL